MCGLGTLPLCYLPLQNDYPMLQKFQFLLLSITSFVTHSVENVHELLEGARFVIHKLLAITCTVYSHPRSMAHMSCSLTNFYWRTVLNYD